LAVVAPRQGEQIVGEVADGAHRLAA
jgi:hypothetical protein